MHTGSPTAPMPVIEIGGLSTVFGPRPQEALAEARAGVGKAALLARGHTLALLDVNLEIEPGEIFVVMGESGSGKSTLVRHINRLIEPTAGRILIAGEDVLALGREALIDLRRRRLAMVFQGFGLLEHLSVVDNVALGLELRGVARAERHRQAHAWIGRVGLTAFEQHLPAQLSGGMRQRVGLARALASETDIILMDEPFSALDPLIRSQLQGELLTLQAELGRTIVFITHDLDEALRIGSRIALLREGRVVQVGTPRDVLMQPTDAAVAAFVRDVNRARAMKVGAALAPWPEGTPLPGWDEAVDAEASIENVLPRLVGRSAPLAVHRCGAIVGQVSMDAVRTMLARGDQPPAFSA
jgi:glycine betaine/proline transport system ATP-binding protein